MLKRKSERSKESGNYSLVTLLEERWRFPHKADLINPQLEKRPIEELTEEDAE